MIRTLILGGARSGKSTRALAVAQAGGHTQHIFVATADAGDDEMRERIALHRQARTVAGGGWHTLEVPLALPEAVRAEARSDTVVVVDCLTLWLANQFQHGRDPAAATEALCAVLADVAGPVVLVSNETGFGLVPQTPLGRAFRDAQGRLNQAVAAQCERVELVVAGLPLVLKAPSGDALAGSSHLTRTP